MYLLFRYKASALPRSDGDPETFQVFADGPGRRIEVSLYGHAERQPQIPQFGQQDVAPFPFVNAGIAEQQPIPVFLFLGLGNQPRTRSAGVEVFDDYLDVESPPVLRSQRTRHKIFLYFFCYQFHNGHCCIYPPAQSFNGLKTIDVNQRIVSVSGIGPVRVFAKTDDRQRARSEKRIGTEGDPLAQPERGRGAEAPTEIARQLVIRRIHIGPCQPAEQLSAVPGLKHAVQNLRIGPQGAGTGIVNRSFHSYNHIVVVLNPSFGKKGGDVLIVETIDLTTRKKCKKLCFRTCSDT